MNFSTKTILCFIFISCSFLLISCSSNTSAAVGSPIFQKYFTPKEDIFSTTLGVQIKRNNDESLTEGLLFFRSVMDLYNQKKYTNVITEIENYFQTTNYDDSFNHQEMKFYLGQAYMATGDFKNSLKTFEQISGKRIFKYNNDLGWFKALNLIELNKAEEAKPYLNTLVSMQTKPHFQKAQELLLEL